MLPRSQILRTLNDAASINRIAEILAREEFTTRGAVGRRVCEEFGFADARGRPQLAGCLKALNAIAARCDRVVLPLPQRPPIPSAPIRVDGSVPLPGAVAENLGELRGLSVRVVRDRAHRRIWNTLMADEHPRGLTTFAGCQMRYLVQAEPGWLGAVGFSACAFHLRARDRWIAWSAEQRDAARNRVVCMSRFLIRPAVRCVHLASHVLGRVLRRLPRDFEAQYGYRPWLVETFVDPAHDGTCLRAANFVKVGQTAGRGRQDRNHLRARSVKSVYMYPLQRDWRRRLGVRHVDHAPRLVPGEGLDSDVWAGNEFGGAELGDKRLTARLIKSATLLAEYPGCKINASPRGDAAAVDGFYRLIEHPENSPVTVAAIVAPHRERTLQRMRTQDTVLCIQDGSDLNFATRPGCEGLEVIGRNQTGTRTLGLHLHATLAVNGLGLPLGVLRCGFDNAVEAGSRDPHRNRRKKTQRWIDGFADTVELTRDLTRKTRVINVCDREGDCFALFDEQRRAGRVELLVRARHDRCLNPRKGRKLFETMRAGDPAGHVKVEVRALTVRHKSSRKKARPARTARMAHCEIRFRRLTLPATVDGAQPVTVSGVHIVEIDPPEGEPPVQWYLLTTLAVEKAETAARVVGYYLQRWRVEEFFRVLKSGCKVELLAFRTADRLQRAITIHAVIAWRIMLMTRLGRQVPNCDAKLMFSDHELLFLRNHAKQHRLAPPDDRGTAIALVASLGGYRARTHDPEPGDQIMWHGYDRLSNATLGHRTAIEVYRIDVAGYV